MLSYNTNKENWTTSLLDNLYVTYTMNAEKPFIEQMKESVPTPSEMKDNVTESAKDIGDSIVGMKDSIKSSLADFSSKSMVDASSEFLDSNSLLAKLAFIILVFIIFMVVLKISMTIIGFFMAPKSNPWLVKGKLSGNDRVVISQNPKDENYVPILLSNDRQRGIEFTYSFWLYLDKNDSANDATERGKLHNIFVKGTGDSNMYDGSGVNLSNGPGVYLSYNDSSGNASDYSISIIMDHVTEGTENIPSLKPNDGRDTVTVNNIPIMKWCHVAVRMQNTIMDIYVNGTIAKRHVMDFAPSQNNHDVIVGGNVGFKGFISNLRYYNYSLNVFELNNIVMFGPNTKTSSLSTDGSLKSGNYTYLANSWYSH